MTDEFIALKRLARAKILLMFQDLATSSMNDNKQALKWRAELFLFRQDEELIKWCDIAEIHIDEVKKAAKDIVLNGLHWRLPAGESPRYLQNKKKNEKYKEILKEKRKFFALKKG